jgi:hypothetical protein
MHGVGLSGFSSSTHLCWVAGPSLQWTWQQRLTPDIDSLTHLGGTVAGRHCSIRSQIRSSQCRCSGYAHATPVLDRYVCRDDCLPPL